MYIGIPAIVNFVIIKLFFSNERVSGNIIWSESIVKIKNGFHEMIFNTYGILPKYFFLIFGIIISLYIIYKITIQNNTIKNKFYKYFGLFYIILGTIVVTIFPQFIQSTDSIWFVARSSYSMGALIGILVLYLLINFQINCFEKFGIILFCTLFLLVEFYSFIVFSTNNYIENYEDKSIAIQINNLITEYENTTGEHVDSIAIYSDSCKSFLYNGVKGSGDMNVKAYSADWALPSIIELYTGRKFKIVEKDKNLEEDFMKRNWDFFDKDQIIIKNNVINLCVF